MKKLMVSLLLGFVLTNPIISYAQTNGDFRSKGTGNWSAAATWEVYSSGWADASNAPTSADGLITIQNGHTVTVDASITVDQLVVATGGILTTNGVTLTINGTNDTINGSFIIGNNAIVNGGVLTVNNGSITLTSGATLTTSADPAIIMNGTSTLSIPSVGGFGSVIRINSGTTTLTSPTATGTVDGRMYVANNIGGDPTAILSIASGKDFKFRGDIIVRPNGTIDGPGTVNFSGEIGTLSPPIGVFLNNGTVNADVKFQRSSAGSQEIRATSQATNAIWNNVEIDDIDGVGVNYTTHPSKVSIIGTLKLTSGNFFLDTFKIDLGNSAKIVRATGTISTALTFGTSIDVEYRGTSGITTGYELPTSTTVLRNLTMNSSANVSISADITVNGVLTLANGRLLLGNHTLTLASTGSLSGGSSTSYIVTDGTGYLVQNVPAAITNTVFPVGTISDYNPLTLNNNGGTTDNYSVRVANSHSNVVDETKVVNDQWTIHESVDGGSNVTLTAQWNFGEEGVSFGGSRASAQIGRYSGTGTSWSTFTASIAGSDPYTAQTTSPLTGAGIFTNSVYGIGIPGALPVEMALFTATAHGLGALLQWKTTTEVNNFGFEIERRALSAQTWTTAVFVAGAGTSNSPKEYSYTDQKLAPGTYVYRIKQIDHNGTFQYSGSAQIEVNAGPKTFELSRNYPNPFNPETRIQYALPEDARVQLLVFDVAGRQVAELVNEHQGAGYYEKTFSGTNLSSGL
jgi:hypothetical protein